SNLHVENTADFVTFNGNIVIGNNGNSLGRLQFSTGGALTSANVAGTGNITYVEDATAKVGNIATTGSISLTSRFGGIIEDPAAADTILGGGGITLNSPNGSVLLGNTTHTTGVTSADLSSATITAGGAASIISNNTTGLALGNVAANSLTVTESGTGNITESGSLNIFGLSTFVGAANITLTGSNNFGPIALTTSGAGSNIAITEGGTMNLRKVVMPTGTTGNFTATSVNGDIIDTGLGGVVIGGITGGTGTGVITLSATNGNITIDDPTTDFASTAGVVFNAKNVTLSVLGNSTLVLGNNTTASIATGNLTATSALGSIGNGGNIVVTGNAFFQTGTGNITLGQTGDQFGTLKFIGNQVNIT